MREHSFPGPDGALKSGATLLRGASGLALCVALLFGAPLIVTSEASAASPAVSETSDPLAMESLMNDPRLDAERPDPADRAAEEAAREPARVTPVTADTNKAPESGKAVKKEVAKSEAGPKNEAAAKAAPPKGKSVAETDLDPEPDGVVVPQAASPSNDPLDRPRPAKGAAKPDAGKANATKVEPPKSEPGKTAEPKTDAASGAGKTGPAKIEPGKTETGKADANKTDAAKTGGAPATPDGKPVEQAAEPPLPPANAAIKAALDKRAAQPIKGPGAGERRKERDAVAFFYAAHGFAPAWSENAKPIAAVEPVLARLAKAGDDALSLTDAPKTLKTDGGADDVAASQRAESDLALTEAVVAYARQASGSRVDPHAIGPLIGAKPELADPAEVLDGLIAAGPQAGDKLAALNPSEPRYVALREKLAELRGTRAPADHDHPKIADGPLLKIGMRDARVPALRARFDVEAKDDGKDADLVFDADVSDALKEFQREHGIQPLGMLGGRTVAALNGGAAPQPNAAKLEGVIIANMEMWRWMPRDMGRERIEVNIPDYAVTVFHDNEAVAHNRVVVGKTETPTPIFSNTMKYLIVNPVWNVPQSIIQNEMHGVAGRGFKSRYVHGKLYIQQESGPKNALGQIKFMFPNQFSVYLHDTPSKHLFGATKRAFSHGCVRVDKPFDFAERVLNDAVPEGGTIAWSQQRLQKMIGNSERYVNLPAPLPIHIEYFTASVDPGTGRVNTREDVYNYAGAVAAALGYGKAPTVVAGDKSLAAEKKPKPRRVARRSYDDDPYDPRVRAPEAAYSQAPRGFVMPW